MFNPDASRGERVAAATAGQIILPHDTQELPDEDPPVEGPCQESDVSSDDLEPDEKGLVGRVQSVEHVRLPFPAVDLQRCRQHRISKIVHLLFSVDTLYCGRSLTANLAEPTFDASQVHEQTFCEQCHKAILA